MRGQSAIQTAIKRLRWIEQIGMALCREARHPFAQAVGPADGRHPEADLSAEPTSSGRFGDGALALVAGVEEGVEVLVGI